MRRLVPIAALSLLVSAGAPALARSSSSKPQKAAAAAGKASDGDAKGTVVHEVRSGQILGKIAERYGVTVKDVCRANGISADKPIRPGQRLVIPVPPRVGSTGARGYSKSAKKANGEAKAAFPPRDTPPKGASWAPYVRVAGKRGYINIAGHGRSWSGYVIGPKGEVLPNASQRISYVLASWRTGHQVDIDERLIRLLARVSDTFGGRTIRIVGGYREHSYARHSKHKEGDALDFSIPGIPNDALRDYLRTLPRVGVGYYPNSTHLHLDVREKPGYWVDYSRPGQRPSYPGRAATVKPAPKAQGRPRRSSSETSGETPAVAPEPPKKPQYGNPDIKAPEPLARRAAAPDQPAI